MPEVDVGRRQVADALVVAEMFVVGDEVADLLLKITGAIVVFEQDAVLVRLMPALDLALRLGIFSVMIRVFMACGDPDALFVIRIERNIKRSYWTGNGPGSRGRRTLNQT